MYMPHGGASADPRSASWPALSLVTPITPIMTLRLLTALPGSELLAPIPSRQTPSPHEETSLSGVIVFGGTVAPLRCLRCLRCRRCCRCRRRCRVSGDPWRRVGRVSGFDFGG